MQLSVVATELLVKDTASFWHNESSEVLKAAPKGCGSESATICESAQLPFLTTSFTE